MQGILSRESYWAGETRQNEKLVRIQYRESNQRTLRSTSLGLRRHLALRRYYQKEDVGFGGDLG